MLKQDGIVKGPVSWKQLYSLLLLMLAAAIILFSGATLSPMYILDETRNAQAAREMMEKNEWIIPTFNGALRADKPPLHYYFMRCAYWVFGVSEWSARFFSVLMGLFTIAITWFFTRRYIGAIAAYWSAAALVSSVHFLLEFQLSVPDPYLIFFITAGLFCFYAYIRETKTSWAVLSAIALSFAALSKGPVALALPGLAALIFLLVSRSFHKILSPVWILYLFIVLVLTMPWFIAVHQATDGMFTRLFFFEQNISRFSAPMEGHGGFFLIVPLFVLLGLLPFSVFSGEVNKRFFAAKPPLLKLCLTVVVVFVAFFSMSGTKLPNYPMPCYPFAAVLFGYCMQRVFDSHRVHLPQYPFLILLVINLLLLGVCFFALNNEEATRSLTAWSAVLLIPVSTTLLCLYLNNKMKAEAALHTLTIGYLIFNFFVLSIAYPIIYHENPVTKTMHLLQEGDQVYAYKIYNPAYNFQLDKSVIILDTKDAIQNLLNKQPDAKIITREQLLPELDGVQYLVKAKERDLFETPITVIISCIK